MGTLLGTRLASGAADLPCGMRHGRGVTLLEILIVLAVLAVLTAGVAQLFLSGGGRRAAESYRAAAVAVRLRALAGTTGSIRWDPERDGFVLQTETTGDDICDGEIRSLLPRPRHVAVTRHLRDGIVWLPDGTGRSCSGGGVYGGRLRFEDRDAAWDVVVSSSGRIRLEPGP